MRSWLAIALVVALGGTAYADESPRVITGGVRTEAGASVAAGTDSVGVVAWVDRPDLNRTASLSFVYRWLGIYSGTEKYRPIVTRPNFGLFLRDFDSLYLITKGGTALGLGKGFGLGVRAGTASGSFSAVLTPSAAFDGFWVVREGWSGFSGRFPLGLELGLEGKVDRLVPYFIARVNEDVWFHRAPAYRAEVLVGLGYTFDLPKPRKQGQPVPPGP